VDLLALVEDVVGDFSRELAKRAIRVSIDAVAPTPAALADPALLAQVLNTLLSNAMEAMPDGGEIAIELRATEDGQRVQLSVRDTGEGIPPEQLQRIFVPYRSTKKSGLGVGLPLVRRVLQRLGGSVEVASTPGSGSVFRLLLRRDAR
jgi:signal transduction histidine kinase